MKLTTLTGVLALAGTMACGAGTTVAVDFTVPTGRINKWLHCSGYGPRSYPRSLENDDKDLAALHLTAARTHDWALINSGQRIVDTQYVFPLPHLDPSDPRNYVFEPTDHVLELLAACRAAGVAPDFMSWHYYGHDPNALIAQPARVRRLLDEAGFPNCKTVINEWHYLVSWDGIHGASSQGKIKKAHSGPSAHNGIDSAAFFVVFERAR